MAHRREDLERGPVRLCVATRETAPPDRMLRFVAGPAGELVPDIRGKLPGRGVWVTLSSEHVKLAMQRKAFARSLGQPVSVSATLVEDIDALLHKDTLQALSFANKAGEAVTGFFKVESVLKSGRAAAVLHAREAAPDGIRKIGQAIRRNRNDGAPAVRIINEFDSHDLSLALGGVHVIHAALEAGPATAGFLKRWARLSAYRGLPEREATSPENQPGDNPPD